MIDDADRAAAANEVLVAAQAMSRAGLTPGRTGNVSRRFGTGMLITASGVAYAELTPADIVEVSLAGALAAGQKKPSSESPFHLAIYRTRPDVGAVVHTHSMHATVLACLSKPIPAFHYMVAAAGTAEIPCVGYETFGSQALSERVAAGLQAANACLMAHHGAIAVGATCAAALELAFDLETLAEQYYKVLTIGPAQVLDAAEMARVLQRFKSYGQRAQQR
jgi:L-fuculose-phosphate aldolase